MLSPARGARRAVLTRLQSSLAPFLAAVGAAEGLQLAGPRSWLPVADYAAVPEEQAPACYVTAGAVTLTGLVDIEGPILQWADVALRVVMVAAGRDRGETEDRAALTCDAARYCLNADVTLNGEATDVRFTGWSPVGVAADQLAVYRAAHDLALVVTVPTTRLLPTTDPAVVPPITLQLTRMEP